MYSKNKYKVMWYILTTSRCQYVLPEYFSGHTLIPVQI